MSSPSLDEFKDILESIYCLSESLSEWVKLDNAMSIHDRLYYEDALATIRGAVLKAVGRLTILKLPLE